MKNPSCHFLFETVYFASYGTDARKERKIMNNRKRKPYLFFIALSESIGLLSGLLSKNGMELYGQLEQPALSPPSILFPIVWTILYALMGFSAAQIWLSNDSTERSLGLRFFFLQLAVNFFWSLIFFNLQAFGFSLIWLIFLWILVLFMILTFFETNRLAALLQIPYLIWLTFAAYLNYMVWVLNR